MPSVPAFLKTMLLDQYGPDLSARILLGYRARRPVTLRVNTLRASVRSVRDGLTAAGICFREVPWSPEALILEEVREPAVRALDLYENGQIYLQSLSSMIPPILLDPQKNESVLDMAAAPGGKTTQMAALSGGLAQITACEKNRVRSERLRYNLNRQGAGSVLVMTADARNLDPFFSFDKILLDAPCSGSGTLYLPEDGQPALPAKKAAAQEGASAVPISEELIRRSAKTQEALLRKALQLLKRGHEMIYSTCSVLTVENELLLRRVLPQAGAEIVPIRHPMTESLPLLPVSLPGTVCICPTELYEGFFVARIRRR